jgi:hypothetical protein
MKKMIPFIIILAVIITSVLFFINIKDKNQTFFYNLGFTLLFEALFIIWFGISADYKNMKIQIKIIFFLFIIIMGFVQFFTLFMGDKTFNMKHLSSTMTTVLLIEAGVEISISFILFAIGNLFSKE